MENGKTLWSRVAAAVETYQRQVGPLERDDLEGLDAFHVGGRPATRALAELIGLQPGARVLDVGCGLGGPARTLAVEYDACVTGVDQSLEMIRTAAFLNRQFIMLESPDLLCGSGNDLPLAPDLYDVVWLQHLLASVEDKISLMAGLGRVLVAKGILALHEVVVLPGQTLDFPLPWAGSPQESFITDEESLLDLFERTGFKLLNLMNWTRPALDWLAAPRPQAWRQLNLKLILGKEAGLRARNLAGGLKSGRARVIQAVLKRMQ